jgi:hypothetical protein
MKTPREILLARHQPATPKLDAIRESTVAAVYDRRKPQRNITIIFENIWRELIFPLRPVWAGLAAVWILILAANLSLNSHSEIKMAKSSSERDMAQNVHQQEQLLTELIGPAETSVAEPQKTYMPRPSSQRPFEIMTT